MRISTIALLSTIALSTTFSTPLKADATITGTVTDSNSGLPIADAQVFVVDHSYTWSGYFPDLSATTDSNGNYSITIPYGDVQVQRCVFNSCSFPIWNFEDKSVGIEVGTYTHGPARWSSAGTVPVSCAFGCDRRNGAGSPNEDLVLTSGSPTFSSVDIELQLGTGANIVGTVQEINTATAIEGAAIIIDKDPDATEEVYNGLGGTTDSAGNYTTLMVPINDAVIQALHPDYAKTFHDNSYCDLNDFNCDATGTVSSNDPQLIEMRPAAHIVINVPTVPPFVDLGVSPTYNMYARVFNQRGVNVQNCDWWSFDTPPLQPCSIDGLAGGQYRVMFGSNHYGAPDSLDNPSSIRQFNDGTLTSCGYYVVELSDASPLLIAPGTTQSVPFPVLSEGYEIEGTVLDGDTLGAPTLDFGTIANLSFELIDTVTGQSGGAVSAHHDGTNMNITGTCSGIKPGQYYLRTWSEISPDSLPADALSYAEGASQDVVCAAGDCDYSGATALDLTSDSIGDVELHLFKGSQITGCLFDQADQAISSGELYNLSVRVYRSDGQFLAKAQSLDDGSGNLCYATPQLPAGDYYLSTQNGTGYFNDSPLVYGVPRSDRTPYFDSLPGVATPPCSGSTCDPSSGPLVSVNGTDHVSDVDFQLDTGSVIYGRLVDQDTGVLITTARVYVDLYAAGETMPIGRFAPQRDGVFQTVAVPDGDYTLTISGLGYALAGRPGDTTRDATGNSSVLITIDGASVDVGDLLLPVDLIHIAGFE